MKFLIDNQLPIALNQFFESEGVKACHVMDVQLDEADVKSGNTQLKSLIFDIFCY